MVESDKRVVDHNTISAYHDYLSVTPGWMKDGECVTHDDGSLNPVDDAVFIARQLCPSCPVIEQCRRWGQEHGVEYGVYGGVVKG